MNKPIYYEQQKKCPVCENKFTVTRVRSSAVFVLERESDFHVKYRDVNPTHYNIWVCPQCQFSASDTTFETEIPRKEKESLAQGLNILKSQEPSFAGERKTEIALRSYELAIRTCQIRHQSLGIQASLFLRAAWICRELGYKELELNYLDKAREFYKNSFESERQQKMSEPSLLYLIGELHRRVGMYNEAIKWFSRAVTHRNIKTEHEIERMARDQWETAKQQFKNAKKDDNEDITDGIKEDTNIKINEETNIIDENIVSTPDDDNKNLFNRLNRTRSKMYLSIYNDQIEWVQKLSNNSYNQTKKLVEKEAIIRAVIDAVIALEIPINEFTSESELSQQIYDYLNKNE